MYQESGIYHIYNRGCNHDNIFFKKENYRYLIKKFEETISLYSIEMIAYCLMPNHYHLLVRQNSERPISKWLQQIFNGYTQAVNKQEGRSGTLFQGRPRHILIDSEEYLLDLIGYIHFNPVKAGLTTRPKDWEFSNCREWYGQRRSKLISEKFIREFLSRSEYKDFMQYYNNIQQAKLLDKFKLDG